MFSAAEELQKRRDDRVEPIGYTVPAFRELPPDLEHLVFANL